MVIEFLMHMLVIYLPSSWEAFENSSACDKRIHYLPTDETVRFLVQEKRG